MRGGETGGVNCPHELGLACDEEQSFEESNPRADREVWMP